MHRFFIPQPYSDTMTIMGVDARHIYTVLRMQCGSRVQIVSDDGVTALAEIADANESVVTVKCLEVLRKVMSLQCESYWHKGWLKVKKWILLSRRL